MIPQEWDTRSVPFPRTVPGVSLDNAAFCPVGFGRIVGLSVLFERRIAFENGWADGSDKLYGHFVGHYDVPGTVGGHAVCSRIGMDTGYLSVFIFFLVAVAFAAVTFAAASLLRPHRPLPEKSTTYECGEQPIGDSWVNIDVHYYVIGLLFVIFDVEAVFLLPWALVIRQVGLFAVVEGAIFLAILGAGLAYAWKKGALEWAS